MILPQLLHFHVHNSHHMQTSLTSETLLKQKLLSNSHQLWVETLKEKPDASTRSKWRDPKFTEYSSKTTQVAGYGHAACKSLQAQVQAQTVLRALLCSTSSKLLFKWKGVDWAEAMTKESPHHSHKFASWKPHPVRERERHTQSRNGNTEVFLK